jgi:MFS family permease
VIFESLKQLGYVVGILWGAKLAADGNIAGNIKIAIYITIFLLIFNNLRPNRNHKLPSLNDFDPIGDIKDFLKIPELRPMAILGATTNFMAPVRVILVPILVIEVLKIDIIYIGYFLGVISFGHLFQFIFGYLCEKYDHINIIKVSLFISAIGLIMTAYSNNEFQLITSGLVLGLALAAWNTSAWTHMSEIGEKYREEGTVVGSYASFSSMGSFLGFLMGGVVLNLFSPRIGILICALVLLLGLLLANILFKKYNLIR